MRDTRPLPSRTESVLKMTHTHTLAKVESVESLMCEKAPVSMAVWEAIILYVTEFSLIGGNQRWRESPVLSLTFLDWMLLPSLNVMIQMCV